MRPPKPFPPGSAQRLQRLLKTAATVAEQRRIQAILIRALDASPPERIAQVTGLSVNTVRVLHSRFLREGEAFLVDRPGRGGRRRTLLDGEQEAALLQRHVQAAGAGQTARRRVLRAEHGLARRVPLGSSETDLPEFGCRDAANTEGRDLRGNRRSQRVLIFGGHPDCSEPLFEFSDLLQHRRRPLLHRVLGLT